MAAAKCQRICRKATRPTLLSQLGFPQQSVLDQDSTNLTDRNPTEPATREISATWKEVEFTTGLMFDETGGLEHIVDPELPAYVGRPTPEMDALWHDLTESRSNRWRFGGKLLQ